MDNKNDENEKRGGAAAKQDPQGDGVKKEVTMVELVGELERLAERFWGGRGVECTAILHAAKVNALLVDANRHAVNAENRKQFAEVVALEAARADKARRLAVGSGGAAKGIDGVAASDGDAAELFAEHKLLLQRYEALLLKGAFALEFTKLAIEFFHPRLEEGVVGQKCRDFAAAKERAKALKQLAAWLDDFEGGKDVGDVHAAIVAYSEACRGAAAAKQNPQDGGAKRAAAMQDPQGDGAKRAAAMQDPDGDGAGK